MNEDLSDYDDDDTEEHVSKTQLKREMTALQSLGTSLISLSEEQLSALPLGQSLLDAIVFAKTCNKREALRRQKQYIGKLMRKEDHEAIAQAYEKQVEAHKQGARELKAVESWRDVLISDQKSLGKFIDQYPAVDRQQLRQLINQATKEKARQKPPAASRKLFRLIRETIELSKTPDSSSIEDQE